MSRYEEYQKKWRKIAAVKNFFLRNVIIISAATAVVLGASAALLFSKGAVIEGQAVEAKYVYGEGMVYSASSFMGGASFEFALRDSDEWTSVEPSTVGSYKMRAVSTNSFGQPTYGGIHYFDIEPKPIVVTIPENAVSYGDEPSVVAQGLLPTDSHHIAGYSFDVTDPKEGKQTFKVNSLSIEDGAGNDVTENYSFDLVSKEVDVIKRKITIAPTSESKVYDGEAIYGSASIVSGSLAEGDRIEFEYNSLTLAGSEETLKEYKILNDNDVDVTSSYEVTVQSGSLLVTKRPISIRSVSLSKVYDGTPFTAEEIQKITDADSVEFGVVDGKAVLSTGDALKPIYADVPENAEPGTYSNAFEYELEHADCYDVSKSVGTLTITQRPISIKVDINKNYEGTIIGGELTSDELFVSSGQLVSGHRLVGEVEAAEYLKPLAQRVFNYRILDDSDQDVTSYYRVTVDSSSIAFTKAQLSLSAKSESKVYDGKPIIASAEISGLLSDDHVSFAYSSGTPAVSSDVPPSLTDVGSLSYRLTDIAVTNDDGSDRTPYYEISSEPGLLEVTRRPLTIELDGIRTYAGGDSTLNPLSTPAEYTLTEGTSLAEGHSLEVDVHNPYTAQKSFTATVVDEVGEDVTSNYLLNFVGDIEFEKATIDIDQTSETSLVYDGYPHRMTAGYTGLQEGDSITIQNNGQSPEYTSAGTYTYTPVVMSLDHSERYVTNIRECGLEIKKRPLKIDVFYNRGTYDGYNYGSALGSSDYSIVGGTSLASGQSLSMVCAYDPFLVEDPFVLLDANNYTPTIIDTMTGANTTSNYDIDISVVAASATKASAPSIVSSNLEKIYDGLPLEGSADVFGFVGNDAPVYQAAPTSFSITEVGSLNYKPTLRSITEGGNATGSNKSGYYDFASLNDIVTSGTLTIKPRPITVSIYPHSDNDNAFRIADGTLADGHYLRCEQDFTDRISYSLKVVDSSGRDYTSNYQITTNLLDGATSKSVLHIYYDDLDYTYDGYSDSSGVGVTYSGTRGNDYVSREIDEPRYYFDGVTDGDTYYGDTDLDYFKVYSFAYGSSTDIPYDSYDKSSPNLYGRETTGFYDINVHQGRLNIHKRSISINVHGSPSDESFNHSVAIDSASGSFDSSKWANWYRISSDSYTVSNLADTDMLRLYVRKDTFGEGLTPVLDYEIVNTNQNYDRNRRNYSNVCSVNDCYDVTCGDPNLAFAHIDLSDKTFEYTYDAANHRNEIIGNIQSAASLSYRFANYTANVTLEGVGGKALTDSDVMNQGDYRFAYRLSNFVGGFSDDFSSSSSMIFDQNYDLGYTDAENHCSYIDIHINRKAATIHLGDYTDWYDGLAFQFNTYTSAGQINSNNVGAFEGNDYLSSISFQNAPSAQGVTALGNEHVRSFQIRNFNGADVTDNYDLTFVGSVNKQEINMGNIYSSSYSQTFNGKPLTYIGTYEGMYSYDRELVAVLASYGFEVSITSNATVGPDVGTADNAFTVKITRFGQDVTSFVSYNPVYGELSITPVTVILVSVSVIIFEGDDFANSVSVFQNYSGIVIKVTGITGGGYGELIEEGDDEYGHYRVYRNDQIEYTLDTSGWDLSNFNIQFLAGTIRVYSF